MILGKQYILTKMFSAEFTKIHKYNLKTKELLSTISVMPYDYTSLYDPQYLPKLSDTVHQKLKSFCSYKFAHLTHPLHDDVKMVKIEHVDDEILRYEIVNPFPYFYISKQESHWNHFVENIDCKDLSICKDNIDRMTDITDDGVTYLMSIEYDKDSKFKYVNVYDASYNLVGYDDHKILHMMNDFCKSYEDRSSSPAGIIGFSVDDVEMKFMIKLHLYDQLYKYEKLSPLPTNIEYTPKSLQREEQISKMIAYNLLDPEDLDFMDSIFSENSRCDFEYIFNEDKTIKEVYLYHYVTYEFKNLLEA